MVTRNLVFERKGKVEDSRGRDYYWKARSEVQTTAIETVSNKPFSEEHQILWNVEFEVEVGLQTT